MHRTLCFLSLALSASLAWFARGEAVADRGSAGVDFRYGNLNINNPLFAFLVGDDDISLIGIDLYANTEVAQGLTVGARIPIAHARFDDDSQTTLGNLTFEMRYQLSAELRTRSWLETSLSIATADDDGDGALVAGAMATFWIPDPGMYLPDTNTVRLMYRHHWNARRSSQASRGLAVEFGAGAHFLLRDDAEDRFRIPVSVTGKLGLSAQAHALARFGTYWTSGAEDGEDDFLHVLEAGLGLTGVGRGSMDILVYLPLDDTYRDTLEAWGLTIGFRSGF
jgi:hypothetical protein